MRMFAEKDITTLSYNIVAYENLASGKHYLHSIVGKEFTWKPVGEDEPAEPFMCLSFEFAEDFINHLVEAMGDAGIKTEPHSYYEGKLEGLERYITTLEKLLSLDDDKISSVQIIRKDADDESISTDDD